MLFGETRKSTDLVKNGIFIIEHRNFIRAEPFSLEQTNELCTCIWLVYKQRNWVGLRHSLHMRRAVQLSFKSLNLMLNTVWMVMKINWSQLWSEIVSMIASPYMWSIWIYIINQVILAFWLVLAYYLLEERCTTDVIITKYFFLCFFKMSESFEN